MPEKKRRLVTLFFGLLFVAMSFELVTDERTYLVPPTESQAQNTVEAWKQMTAWHPAAENRSPEETEKLAEFMSSEARYRFHRGFLALLLFCYLVCLLALRRRAGFVWNLISAVLVLKIIHSLFFLTMAYEGRRIVSDTLFGDPRVPLLIFGNNEKYYLLVIAFSVFALIYCTMHKRALSRQRYQVP